MFRKGHIYLGKFQESFLRLDDTDFQMMETKQGTRQTAVWAQREKAKIAMSGRSVQFGEVFERNV